MDLSKVVKPGSRIEVKIGETKTEESAKKFYASRISDVHKNGDVEIYMPTDQGKMVMVAESAKLSLYFYSKRGMYRIGATVKERYKDGGLYLLRVSLYGELKRIQRREYYRYSCKLNMMGRVMDGAEKRWLMERGKMIIMDGEPLDTNTIADISGGGIKFSSANYYPPESLIYCEIEFGRLYKLCAVVIDVKPDEKDSKLNVHRAQFYGMSNEEREELVKYIFDLELQERRKANEGQ